MAAFLQNGAGARAIQVENLGSSAGRSEISIGKGAVIQGGSKNTYYNALSGAGVYIHSDRDSTLNNAGTISAVSNIAIHSFGGGTLTLNNTGTVDGSILATNLVQSSTASVTASAETNTQTRSSIRFDNLTGGVLNAGETLDVARLRNWGQFNVGKAGSVATTRVTGDLVQTAGRLNFDVDMSNDTIDFLTVDGQANLGSELKVNVVQIGEPPRGAQDVKIIKALGRSGCIGAGSHSIGRCAIRTGCHLRFRFTSALQCRLRQ